MPTILLLVVTFLLCYVAADNARKVGNEFGRYKPVKTEKDTLSEHERRLSDFRDNLWRLGVARVCAGVAGITAIAAVLTIVFHIG